MKKTTATIKFFRKTDSNKFDAVFTFPVIDDIQDIKKNQIIRDVSLTFKKRGRYVFNLKKEEIQNLE